MNLTKLQIWNLIEGVVLLCFTLSLVIYPSLIEIINFSDQKFTESDYQIVRASGAVVFVISGYFISFGLEPYFKKYIAPIFLGRVLPKSSNEVLLFSITTITNRLIVVPIALAIMNMLTWSCECSGVIRVATVMYLIYDPGLAIVTIFVIRKFGLNDEQKTYNLTMEENVAVEVNRNEENNNELQHLNRVN